MNKQIYANIGCGGRFQRDWLNLDLNPANSEITKCDISKGIPLQKDTCDVVYHSHFLEHLKPDQVKDFLQECYRVLKPGGVLRVVVPDLEQICRLYLKKLEMCCSDNISYWDDYQWILIEMYDQSVREVSGGRMKEFLTCDELKNEAFIASRIGQEYHELITSLKGAGSNASHASWKSRLKNICHQLKTMLKGALLRCLLGEKGIQALAIGRFRQSGEVHQWMYDRVSLSKELVLTGFVDTVVQSATSSYIPCWQNFGLDALPDATPVKPDSLYMEARKPYAL